MLLVERSYHVYILTNRSGTLYTGVTNDLQRRLSEHKSGESSGFTSKYKSDRLLYVEMTSEVTDAIAREKQIKAWTRQKRIDLINSMNPKWLDLSSEWGDETSSVDG